MVLGLVAALAAAVVFGFSAILQARAVRRLDASRARHSAEDAGRVVLRLLREPLFLAVIGLNLMGFLLHLVAIRLIPLYLAQAAISMSLAVTALLAVALMREHLTLADRMAVGAITLGLVMLAFGSGDIGDTEPPGGFVGWMAVGLLAIAVAGVVVVRSRPPYAASLLGFLGGLGFAGSGLAARILPGLTPAELWDSAATYLLPLCGAVAFALYSIALRLGTVTEATGPLTVMQTVTPALVGVVVLDDAVRSGWGLVALSGFVLSVVGAVALARFETGPSVAATARESATL
jgi:drug/metabolite transporter (DMT)-like permease